MCAVYEALFSFYVGFVLVRVGKNFFYDTFLKELFWSEPARHVELLSFDFYLSAGLFFVLWTGLLVMAFARRLRSGLNRMIEELSRDLAGSRLDDGLFPRLEQACRDIDVSRAAAVVRGRCGCRAEANCRGLTGMGSGTRAQRQHASRQTRRRSVNLVGQAPVPDAIDAQARNSSCTGCMTCYFSTSRRPCLCSRCRPEASPCGRDQTERRYDRRTRDRRSIRSRRDSWNRP